MARFQLRASAVLCQNLSESSKTASLTEISNMNSTLIKETFAVEAAAVQLITNSNTLKQKSKVGNSNLHNLLSHIYTALSPHHYLLNLKFHRTFLIIIIHCFLLHKIILLQLRLSPKKLGSVILTHLSCYSI